MKLIRSISGIRGIIGHNFNDTIAADYAKAFSSIQKQGPILIGRDTRNQGTEISTKIKEGLTSLGRNILDCDIAPTPVIQFLAKELNTSGAIMITASHNPMEWNGLKFIDSDGCFINKDKINLLLNNIDTNSLPKQSNNKGKSISHVDSLSIFIDALLGLDFVDVENIKKQHFKVVVDTVNGANYHLLPHLLRMLNCEVIELYCNSSGIFDRNPEPTPENLTLLSEYVIKYGADLGLASDPDGDRLSIVDNKGVAIGEENTLVLCADTYYKETNSKSPLVTNLSSSMCLDFIASKHNVPIYRSAIGEANVIELMKHKKSSFGGEGNGGVILKDIHLGRDSLVGTIMILDMLCKRKKNLNQIMDDIPDYYMIKEKIELSGIDISLFYNYLSSVYHDAKSNTTDGLKLVWQDKWLHIRKSNTEPVVRVIAESLNPDTTREIIENTIKKLKEYSIED